MTHVLAADGLDDILGRGAEELGDDGELVDVCQSQRSVRGCAICVRRHVTQLQSRPRMAAETGAGSLRSFPGKSGFPSSISAKMHPVLQMSTARVQRRGESACLFGGVCPALTTMQHARRAALPRCFCSSGEERDEGRAAAALWPGTAVALALPLRSRHACTRSRKTHQPHRTFAT